MSTAQFDPNGRVLEMHGLRSGYNQCSTDRGLRWNTWKQTEHTNWFGAYEDLVMI